jgi:hypothetical protein
MLKAAAFSEIVTIAAAMESHAKRVSEEQSETVAAFKVSLLIRPASGLSGGFVHS